MKPYLLANLLCYSHFTLLHIYGGDCKGEQETYVVNKFVEFKFLKDGFCGYKRANCPTLVF